MADSNPVSPRYPHRLFPPRGIFIPNEIIFNTQFSAAIILTWIKLRCLAWDGGTTPPRSIPELASLLGIHPTRLSRHLYQLHAISVLTWRTTSLGKITISFPESPDPNVEPPGTARRLADSGLLNTANRETPAVQAYFPHQIMGYLSNPEDLEEFSLAEDPEGLVVEQVEIENYLIHS